MELEYPLRFFDDDAIAVLFQGHYYGVRSIHPQCFPGLSLGGMSEVLASDEYVPYLQAEHHCFACGQPLLSDEECAAVVRLREELHLTSRPVPLPLFHWQKESCQYEAWFNGRLLIVTYGMMTHTLYKCLRAGLAGRRAFDASEWEESASGRLRFLVLKKRAQEHST